MALESKNVGQIAAVLIGTSAPTNYNVIWIDRTGGFYIPKSWNPTDEEWQKISGSQILFGAGAPANGLGSVSDMYINTDAPNQVYSKTAAAVWTEMFQINPTSGDVKRVLFSNVPLSVTGTTAETLVFTGIIPAGAIGSNGVLLFDLCFSGIGSAGTKTTRVKVNGVTINTLANTSNTQFIRYSLPMVNRNAPNSQFLPPTNIIAGLGFAQSSTSTGSTSTIDTNIALTIEITIQNASAADTFKLETLNVTATY